MKRAFMLRFAGLLMAAAGITGTGIAAELPQQAPEVHVGVATCASSTCHGRVVPDGSSNVLQNEYRTWTRHDRHSGAYQTLLSSASRDIARKLGLENAHEADVCLDCHADNVDQAKRGARFHIEDGVGCEACHGGAERWLTRHAAPGASHESNVAAGMYPTGDLVARTELCLSCHLGSADKFATHQVMGAGHPRLAFELDTFTIRQPEHYVVDEDYRQRKSDEDAVKRWAVGALVTARRYVELLQTPLFMDHPVYPDLGLFDCHSCHSAFNDLTWSSRPATAAVGPGQVRLNDSSLLIAALMLSEVDPEQGEMLYRLITSLHGASTENRQAVAEISRRIMQLLEENRPRVVRHRFSAEEIAAVRNRLLNFGVRGEFRDYAGAEQAVMSVDVLSFALGQPTPRIRGELDQLYETVRDDDLYPPSRLIQEFRAFQEFVAE
jgi:hypothetical protein